MSGTGRRPRVNPLIAGFFAGVLIALVVGLMATINLQYGAPWAKTHTVTARVADADSMSVGSDVRIGGRLVGQVVSIKAQGDFTEITFHVDDADWPLPADTTANVRLATLLGQKYIQLNPGHATQMMADNTTIGLQRTKPVVDFDQILDTFDKPTRDALTQFIRTVSAAVQSKEGTLQQLIPDLSDLSVHSQTPTQELVTRDTQLNSILVNLGVTADQLDASRNDLAGVIDNLNTINAALASNGGKALKGYITNTDTLNLTTNAVLGTGAAPRLASGLQRLSTFAANLNLMLEHLLPQTASFNSPDPLAEPSDRIPSNPNAIPAVASIDLIYEIGNATSQGYGNTNFGSSSQPNYQSNFWLRQNVAGVDPCGLISSVDPTKTLCGTPSSPSHTPSGPTTVVRPPNIPLPHKVCIGPTCITLPCVPAPGSNCPTPTLPPTPCLPLPGQTCPPPPTPCIALPLSTPCPSPSPTSSGAPILPTLPVPTPTLPLGLGQTTSDDASMGAPALVDAAFPARYR